VISICRPQETTLAFLAQQETTPTGTLIVSPSSVVVDPDMSGGSNSGDAQFPHLPPRKAVVLKHWTLVSDDRITAGRNSGQYKATFKCNIVDGDGKACGLTEASCTTKARLSPLPISSDMSQIVSHLLRLVARYEYWYA
jgi:hypothetical protein